MDSEVYIQRYMYNAFINLGCFCFNFFFKFCLTPPPFLVTKTMEIAGEVHFFSPDDTFFMIDPG